MKLKTAKAVMWVLLSIFCVLMLLMAWTRFAPFGYAAIATIIVYGIINIAFWRCPNCGKCIGGIWLGKYNHCRYGQVAEEVENFTVHYKGGFVFTLCENLLGAFIGYVACINKHIPQVLLDGSKNLELVQRLIGIYQPEYIWMPTVRVNEIGGKSIYTYQEYSLQLMAYDEPLIDRTINSELL